MIRTRRLAVSALLLVVLVAAFPLALRAGTVTTRDGKTYQGRTGWGEGGTVIVEPVGDDGSVEAHSFSLADVTAAKFDRAPAAAPTTVPATAPTTAPTTAPATPPGGWVAGDVGGAGGDSQFEPAAERLLVHDNGKPLRAGKKLEKKLIGDSLHFIYQRVDGDFEIVARVYSEDAHIARAGLMARESLDPTAPYALVCRGGGYGDAGHKTSLLARPESGAPAEVISTSELTIIGVTWVRLKRNGARFDAFESPNGKTWTPVGQADVPFTAKTPAYVGLASACGEGRESFFDHPRLTTAAAAASQVGPAQSLVFRDGTLLAAEIIRADDSQVTYRRAGEEHTAPVRDLARALLRPVGGDLTAKLDAAPGPGVLLTGGDFMDGDFKGISDGRANVSNLLFGLRSFDVDRQVAAVNWAKPDPAAAHTQVLLTDGSHLEAKSIAAGPGVLKVTCPVAGELTVRLDDVAELKAAGPTPKPGT